jgi:hypothetical protein
MSRTRAFTTAASRRRADPIVWEVDGTAIRLRASIDLGEVAPLIEAINAPFPDGANQVEVAASKRAALLETVRAFVLDDDRSAFDQVSPDLDMGILGDMVQDLVAEYSGANPTLPPSSSDGSSANG